MEKVPLFERHVMFSPKKAKKGSGGWEQDPSHKPNLVLFFSNYPLHISHEAVLGAFSAQILDRYGQEPRLTNPSIILDGFTATASNEDQLNAMRELNGILIFNQPLWIVRLPTKLGVLCDPLSRLFHQHVSNGVVDLANLGAKFEAVGSRSDWVNFKSRDFVEFLLFRLGTNSRDDRFFVESLVLNQNPIESVNEWSPFFAFLPNLHYLYLEQTLVKQQPQLVNCPYVLVIWSKK
jgi:hypothetical protein